MVLAQWLVVLMLVNPLAEVGAYVLAVKPLSKSVLSSEGNGLLTRVHCVTTIWRQSWRVKFKDTARVADATALLPRRLLRAMVG